MVLRSTILLFLSNSHEMIIYSLQYIAVNILFQFDRSLIDYFTSSNRSINAFCFLFSQHSYMRQVKERKGNQAFYFKKKHILKINPEFFFTNIPLVIKIIVKHLFLSRRIHKQILKVKPLFSAYSIYVQHNRQGKIRK